MDPAPFGVDPWDTSLYDMVIHIHKLTVEDAVEYIAHATGRPCFETTPEAQRKMDDVALACRVKAALVKDEYFEVGVTSEFGNVVVYTAKGGRHQDTLDQKVKKMRRSVPGINHLEVHKDMRIPPKAV